MVPLTRDMCVDVSGSDARGYRMIGAIIVRQRLYLVLFGSAGEDQTLRYRAIRSHACAMRALTSLVMSKYVPR